MSKLWATILFLSLILVAGNAHAQCNWTCPGSGAYIPLTGTAEVRLVFVAFSDTPYGDDLPTWKDDFITEMEEYYDWTSNGKFHINLEVPTPPGQPTKAWLAPYPSSAYRHSCGDPNELDTSDLNAWVIQEIYNQLGSTYWEGVQSLYVTYIGNPFGCGVPIPRAVATLGITQVPDFDPADYGFTAQGVSQGFHAGLPLNSQENKYHLEGAMAHEFGHNLGRGHIASTGLNPGDTGYCGQPFSNPETVNMGRYSIMDSWTGATYPWVRPWSYHPINLIGMGWVNQEIVWASPCTTTVTIPDIRDPVNGKVVAVHSMVNPGQYFLLANVEGTGRDADLGANGLLIWHISSGSVTAWDLESARGKDPDPVYGHDPLEADACEFGAAGDIWDGSPGRDAFNPSTNPNTNFYDDTYQSQPTVTGISINNIRKVGTDVLVDIYLDQPAQITSPQAGAFYSVEYVHGIGPYGGVPVRWVSCASVVDVQISDASGGNFTTVADDIANTGSYNILGDYPTGTGYLVRVIPDNNPGGQLTSGAFMIWDTAGPSVLATGQDCQTDSVQVTSAWVISPTVETVQQIVLYPDSFSQFYTKSQIVNNFAPTMTVNVDNEPGLWHYNVTLAPTTWGPGYPESASGTFVMNGFTTPKPGGQYAIDGPPLTVSWYLCGASVVDVQISDETGSTFTTVADDIPNSGSTSVSLTGRAPGENYLIKIIPDNNPGAAIVCEPFTLWTITSYSVTKTQSCANHTVTFTANWTTSVSLAASNTFLLISPTAQVTNEQWSDEGTAHTRTVTVPCEAGTWSWGIVTQGGTPLGTVVRSGTYGISCPSCPPGCHDCQFENSFVDVVIGQGKDGGVAYLVKEFSAGADVDITGATFVTGDNRTIFPEAMLLKDMDVSSPDARLAVTGPIGSRTAVRMESGAPDKAAYVREVSWEPVSVKAGTVLYLAIALPATPGSEETAEAGIGAAESKRSGSYYLPKSSNDPVRLKEDLLVRLMTGDGGFIDERKPEVTATSFLAAGVPNPFRSQVEMKFGLAVDGHARLNVYDLSGALVRTLVDADLPAGEHHAFWDGRDRSGHMTSAGLYFMRLEEPTGTLTRKLLRIR